MRDTDEPVINALTQLLRAGETAREVRPDVNADDVLLLAGSLWRIEPGPRSDTRASRILDLLIDGLRPQPQPQPRARR